MVAVRQAHKKRNRSEEVSSEHAMMQAPSVAKHQEGVMCQTRRSMRNT
jgi:hypothetical protein